MNIALRDGGEALNHFIHITLTTEGMAFTAAENRKKKKEFQKRNGISALNKGTSLKAIIIPRERNQSPKADETLASQPEAKRTKKEQKKVYKGRIGTHVPAVLPLLRVSSDYKRLRNTIVLYVGEKMKAMMIISGVLKIVRDAL